MIKSILSLNLKTLFGESDPALIMAVPNALLGDHIEEGMKVAGTVLDPTDENIYTVLGPASSGETILDGNHPLAGEALTIDIEILRLISLLKKKSKTSNLRQLLPIYLKSLK